MLTPGQSGSVRDQGALRWMYFNNMLDIEYSQILSKKNNFGIAEALIQQFQPLLNSKRVK